MPLDPLQGGLRDRVIEESFHALVEGSLNLLGWFTSRPDRQNVEYRSEPVLDGELIIPNLVVAVVEGVDPEEEAELGSTLSNDAHLAYVDIYAESEAVGKQLAGDVRCILMGQHPAIGRDWPVLVVYDFTDVDYSLATPNPPDVLFRLVIERVRQARAHRVTEEWQRHMFAVSAELNDEHD